VQPASISTAAQHSSDLAHLKFAFNIVVLQKKLRDSSQRARLWTGGCPGDPPVLSSSTARTQLTVELVFAR
jgi:hypothetical protein